MPNELCWLSSREIGFQTVEDRPLLPHQIRVRTHMARVRHGSDLVVPENIGHVPKKFQSWGVADVVEIGDAVDCFAMGDRVYGPMVHADRQVLDAQSVYSMSSFSNRPEFSTFIDAGIVALRCIHASGLRFGDRIAIWGLGTVGLMALQYAWMSGAREIIAIDPLLTRLDTAQKLGAHRIEQNWLEENDPVNTAIDCSGSSDALRKAVQSVLPEGTVVAGADTYDPCTYKEVEDLARQRGIHLFAIGKEAGSYDLQDRVHYSIVSKLVVVWSVISHYLPFENAPALCQDIRSDPNQYVQVIWTY